MNVSTAKDKAQGVIATRRDRLAEKRLARVEDKYETLRAENEVLRREFKETQTLQDRLLKALETRTNGDQALVREKPRRRWVRVLVVGGAAAALVTRREQITQWIRQRFGGGGSLYDGESQTFPEDRPSAAPGGEGAPSKQTPS